MRTLQTPQPSQVIVDCHCGRDDTRVERIEERLHAGDEEGQVLIAGGRGGAFRYFGVKVIGIGCLLLVFRRCGRVRVSKVSTGVSQQYLHGGDLTPGVDTLEHAADPSVVRVNDVEGIGDDLVERDDGGGDYLRGSVCDE